MPYNELFPFMAEYYNGLATLSITLGLYLQKHHNFL